MSFKNIPRNYGNKISNYGQHTYDSMDIVGKNPLNLAQVRINFIRENAIQVPAPVPTSSAMDSAACKLGGNASFQYANQQILAYFVGAGSFIGYYAMALISQNWLVMKGCSSAAKDAMKKGYELTSNDGEPLDKKKIKQINKLDKKYSLRKNIIEGETFNNVFGVRHILFKHTDPGFDYSEPFNADSFKNGKYAGISQIDPYWLTPELDDRDIADPTAINYYEPTYWLVNGTRYHKSHFVILVGEHVPDYLKPSYRYGGLSMVQKVYERVYAGERTANEIPQLAMTKRLGVRKTDLEKVQANKGQFIKNLNTMNEFRDNYGVQVIGLKEEISQLETSLADLDDVMWANYHLVASIFGRPVSKIYGTGHGGLGTGDTDDDYDISQLESLQTGNLEEIAQAHYERLMMSEFGEEMDLDIIWNSLKVTSEKDLATINFTKSQTAMNEFNIGAIGDVDERERLMTDKTSGYSGMEKLETIPPPNKDDESGEDD